MDANEPETARRDPAQTDHHRVVPIEMIASHLSTPKQRKILSLAMKGLISVLIVFAVLFFGRSIVSLYQPLSPPSSNLTSLPTLSMDRPVFIGFGQESHVMFQQEIRGSQTEAENYLKNICAEIAKSSPMPRDDADDAERDLLDSVLPDEAMVRLDRVAVCSISPRNPIFIGIKTNVQDESQSNLSDGYRIVAWGFATQTQLNHWKLRVVGYESPTLFLTGQTLADALPPRSQRLLQLASNGESILAFTCESELEEQIAFFNQFFQDNAWEQSHEWRKMPDQGQGTYFRADGKKTETVRIQLSRKPFTAHDSPHDQKPRDWQGIISLTCQLNR